MNTYRIIKQPSGFTYVCIPDLFPGHPRENEETVWEGEAEDMKGAWAKAASEKLQTLDLRSGFLGTTKPKPLRPKTMSTDEVKHVLPPPAAQAILEAGLIPATVGIKKQPPKKKI